MLESYKLVALILKNARLIKNYSIRYASRKIDISDTELSRIENGERKNYNMINLINLCELYSIDFVKLLKFTGYLKPEKEDIKDNKLKWADEFIDIINYKNYESEEFIFYIVL